MLALVLVLMLEPKKPPVGRRREVLKSNEKHAEARSVFVVVYGPPG